MTHDYLLEVNEIDRSDMTTLIELLLAMHGLTTNVLNMFGCHSVEM